MQPGSLQRGDNLAVTFEVADGGAKLPVAFKGILPDLFREGQGVVAEGALDANGVFKADTVLAKHDETYMPKDVADALKKQGHWKDDYGAKESNKLLATPSLRPRRRRAIRRGAVRVIVEAGHYALVLALALALIQSFVPMIGARLRDPALMNRGALHRAGAAPVRRRVVHRAGDVARELGFLRRQCRQEFPLHEADDLQDHRSVGKP